MASDKKENKEGIGNIAYIARDIERAMGKLPENDYFIITNESPYSLEIKEKYPNNVFLIKKDEILDTYELLILPEVEEIINKLNAKILVFKNSIHIEQFCKEKNYTLLNPSAELSEKIENKITQIEWLGDLASLLPSHKISIIKDIKWNKKPLVLQWSHGHTGEGTLLIQNENDLNIQKEKFPYREARITDFIKGPMFTVNIVVTDTVILLGNISYQITGMLPFTENVFSTIGNDWALPHTILSENHIKNIEEIAEKIGQKMQRDNWKGLFGIDIIYDEECDKIYLIEINARQPASTTYESELQKIIYSQGVQGITIFDAHLEVLTKNLNNTAYTNFSSLIPINDGAQILQRVTENILKEKIKINEESIKNLIKKDYRVIIYNNTKPNADLIRIQSLKGIMEAHNKFKTTSISLFQSLISVL